MIGSSSGEQFDSITQWMMPPRMPPEAPEKPAGESKEEAPTQGTPHFDYSKDVPLAASALHKDGEFYGVAIDKDAPKPPDKSYHEGVYMHEKAEFDHMKNLISAGMKPVDAYHEAHDRIATPIESAFIRGQAAAKGQDPDQALDAYKEYWRNVASFSGQKETPDRHPDAHTTTYGLDEAELKKTFTHEAPKPQPKIKNFMDAVLDELKDTLTYPFKATQEGLERSYAGNPPGREETADMASRMAGYVGTGGIGMPRPAGSLGMFGGQKGAYNAGKIDTLVNAMHMENTGSSREAVWNKTGWYKGADDQWKFEINDRGSFFDPMPLLRNSKVKLPEVFDHPALFEAYPFLKNVTVSKMAPNKEVAGQYFRGQIELNLNRDTVQDIKSTVLHELQHAIQYHEGFGVGANYSNLVPSMEEKKELTGSEVTNREMRAYRQYSTSPGEVESRNTQFRMNMDEEERREFYPWLSQDVPTHLQRPDLMSRFASPLMEFDEAKINRLKLMYDQGRSYNQIATALKTTRGAVAGMIDRLGWTKGRAGSRTNVISKPAKERGVPSLPKLNLPPHVDE